MDVLFAQAKLYLLKITTSHFNVLNTKIANIAMLNENTASARPIYHQWTVYTRFKKCHGLKFQSVYVPDGFIACLFGPVPVKTHNSRLLQESELLATHYATNSCHYNLFTLWRSSIPSKCILTWRFSKCGSRIQ